MAAHVAAIFLANDLECFRRVVTPAALSRKLGGQRLCLKQRAEMVAQARGVDKRICLHGCALPIPFLNDTYIWANRSAEAGSLRASRVIRSSRWFSSTLRLSCWAGVKSEDSPTRSTCSRNDVKKLLAAERALSYSPRRDSIAADKRLFSNWQSLKSWRAASSSAARPRAANHMGIRPSRKTASNTTA